TGVCCLIVFFFFFQAEDGIRDLTVTGVQTCALPIYLLLKPIDFRREELNRTSTSGTDHVMVATAIVLMLVTRNTVVKGNFTRKRSEERRVGKECRSRWSA